MELRIPIKLLAGKPVGYLQVVEDLASGLLWTNLASVQGGT